MATYEFKKRWLNAEHSLSQIEYWQYDQFQKVVNENKPLYTEWVAAGNTPEEIEYVEPPAPTPVPDWTAFRSGLKGSAVFQSLRTSAAKATDVSCLIDALRQGDLDDVRLFAGLIDADITFTEQQKTGANNLAASCNIGAIFA